MSQGTMDSRKLQRLMVQGQLIVDDFDRVLRSDNKAESSRFHWKDATRWQASAIEFIKEADESLLDGVTELHSFQGRHEIFGAITSTMLALTTLAALEKEASAQPTQIVSPPESQSTQAHATSVFIVHGHNEVMKLSVARFIDSLGLTPIVLHEQPNIGQTIIEKFEKTAAQAGFAVVLMSPDDIGSSIAEPKKKSRRARQNVVMELGYFTGALGRSRITVLLSKGVEIPSDYMGVIYTEFDPAGAWKLKLAADLRSSGYKIDTAALIEQ